MGYYVYIVRCEDASLYTGITTDVARRMAEHRSQAAPGAKYTRTRKVIALEALWKAPDRMAASTLEYRIKQLRRAQKLALVEHPERADAVAFPKFDEAAAKKGAPGTFRVFKPASEEECNFLWNEAISRDRG